jgi:hypothetical protein
MEIINPAAGRSACSVAARSRRELPSNHAFTSLDAQEGDALAEEYGLHHLGDKRKRNRRSPFDFAQGRMTKGEGGDFY